MRPSAPGRWSARGKYSCMTRRSIRAMDKARAAPENPSLTITCAVSIRQRFLRGNVLVTFFPIFSLQRTKNPVEFSDRLGQESRTQMLVVGRHSQVFMPEQLRDRVNVGASHPH